MSRVEEIKTAIDGLSPRERCELNLLLHPFEDDEWDQQMKADADAGKLDFLIEEAERAEREGTLRELPTLEE